MLDRSFASIPSFARDGLIEADGTVNHCLISRTQAAALRAAVQGSQLGPGDAASIALMISKLNWHIPAHCSYAVAPLSDSKVDAVVGRRKNQDDGQQSFKSECNSQFQADHCGLVRVHFGKTWLARFVCLCVVMFGLD